MEKVVFRDPSPDFGYLILPDMKWDLTTLSSLYLVAISFNRGIRSLRDLTKAHLPMLNSIRREGARVVHERWGLAPGFLRMFIHYQPSYCAYHLFFCVKCGLLSLFCARPLPCAHRERQLRRATRHVRGSGAPLR